VLYIVAIVSTAFRVAREALFVVAALIWLIPDRRIEDLPKVDT
jgi:hypothetical protein